MVQKQFYSISRQHPKSLPQSIRHHYIDNLLVWRHSRRKEIFYACLGLRDIQLIGVVFDHAIQGVVFADADIVGEFVVFVEGVEAISKAVGQKLQGLDLWFIVVFRIIVLIECYVEKVGTNGFERNAV